MRMTVISDKAKGRETIKNRMYRFADERSEEIGLGNICVLCSIGLPGGSYIASERHEILSKSLLPGKKNLGILFSLENIAPACREHHQALGHLRMVWLHAMVRIRYARPEQYQVGPFKHYWQDAPYPPCGECLGHFGFGTEFFKSHPFPGSLKQLYVQRDPTFVQERFCESCRHRSNCRIQTETPADSRVTAVGDWK